MTVATPPMTMVIAERKLTAVLPTGKRRIITIQIGRPARDPNPNGAWYCPIRVKGMGKVLVHSFFGVDQLQALQFAQGILDLEVHGFAESCRLSWLGQPDLGLKPWIPKLNG